MRLLLCLCFVLALLPHSTVAQRVTFVDDNGNTIIGYTTTDPAGDIRTHIILTVSTPTQYLTPETTTNLPLPSPTPTVATAQVAQGQIMEYSTYMQSVSADASRRIASAAAAYMATASDFGVRQAVSGADASVERATKGIALYVAIVSGVIAFMAHLM